jgi:hypothetical protein
MTDGRAGDLDFDLPFQNQVERHRWGVLAEQESAGLEALLPGAGRQTLADLWRHIGAKSMLCQLFRNIHEAYSKRS